MKRLFVFVILYLLATKTIVAQKTNPLPKNNIIYFMQQDFKKNKVKIGFVSKSGTTKTYVSKTVLRNKSNAYIKFATDAYYLSVDSLPVMVNDICSELQKIKIDTTLLYGEPFSRSVSVILVIDEKGKIETYGIARGVNSNYYEDATLKILQQYSDNNDCKPAIVDNKTVCSILRISFNFGEGKCTMLTNSPPFFYSAKSW
jgi:hypothetical protein